MMDSITNFINDVNSNQALLLLFSGGLIWTLLANIRSIIGTIWAAVLACISFTISSVTVADYDRQLLSFKILKVLSESKVLWERHTELTPQSTDYNEKHLSNSAYGRSYRWMWGHLIVLDRDYSMQSTKLVTTITARVFFARRRKFIERLMKCIEDTSLTNSDNICVDLGASVFMDKPKRSIDSIYTNDNSEHKLLTDLRAFIANKHVYESNNSPYKFVGLLCGTPGSGKTSTIHAIASEMDMGVRYINAEKADFDDIARIMNNNNGSTGKRNILVMEDIDCLSMSLDNNRMDTSMTHIVSKAHDDRIAGFENKWPTLLSLSSILNLLDGIVTPNGTIVFLTTNKPEKLDAALLRDGRIDARYDFGNFNPDTANRLLKDHLGFEIADIKDGIMPSSLQRDVLKVKIGRMTKDELVEKYSKPHN